jgi:protein-disulfide isomerase-like protein with CxxC motif
MKLMGCSADTLFDAPSETEQTVISVIEDLYQAFEQSGMDPTIENVVNGLCEYFGLTKAQVHEQFFALMQSNHLLVENGLFYVPDGQE